MLGAIDIKRAFLFFIIIVKGVELVIDFIAKYWIEVLFGLIISGATVAYKFISEAIKKKRQEKLDG